MEAFRPRCRVAQLSTTPAITGWTAMKISTKWVQVIGATAVGLVAAANAAFAPHKASLRLDWVYGSEHAPIFLAIEKGFFKDENIDLNLMPGEGSSVTTKLAGSRDTDFGYATADQVLIGAQRGLPLVATAAERPQHPAGRDFKGARRHQGFQTRPNG